MKRIVAAILNSPPGPSTTEEAKELREAIEQNATASENERSYAEKLARSSEGLREALRFRSVPQAGDIKRAFASR